MNTAHGNRVRSAARWSGLEIALRYAFQLVVMVGLARLVDPSAFGAVAMVTVFTALGTVFIDSGTGMALIQKQRSTPGEETSTFVLNLAISFAACGLLIALAPTIARFYDRPDLEAICIAMSFVFPLNGLAVVPDAMLTQQMRFDLRTRVEIASSLTSGLVALGAAAAHLGAWALVWQALSSIGSRTLMLYVLSGWRPRGRPSLADTHTVTSFGGYMLVAGLIDTAYTRVQALLIGKHFSAGDVGQYTLAQNTQQAPASFVAAILNRLGLPLLSSIRDDHKATRTVLEAGMQMGLFGFIPVMATLAVLAVPMVDVVYGARWTEAGQVLAILALGSIPWPAHVLNLVAMNSQGRPRLVLNVEVVKKSFAVILLLTAAPHGLLAIAWSTVIASLFSFFLNAWFVGRLLGYGINPQVKVMAWSSVPALGAAAAGWCCVQYIGNGALGLAVAWLASALATLAIGVVCRHPALPALLRLLPGHRPGPSTETDHVDR
ncbi:lipopolysaccharide biosynthesis protein [Bacillus sp. NP157]|nr:lipopolysaccharide biosynthesis protein [Bacillus sp. NP157]